MRLATFSVLLVSFIGLIEASPTIHRHTINPPPVIDHAERRSLSSESDTIHKRSSWPNSDKWKADQAVNIAAAAQRAAAANHVAASPTGALRKRYNAHNLDNWKAKQQQNIANFQASQAAGTTGSGNGDDAFGNGDDAFLADVF